MSANTNNFSNLRQSLMIDNKQIHQQKKLKEEEEDVDNLLDHRK